MALIQNTSVIGTSYVSEVLSSPSHPQHQSCPPPPALLPLLESFPGQTLLREQQAGLIAVYMCWAILIN